MASLRNVGAAPTWYRTNVGKKRVWGGRGGKEMGGGEGRCGKRHISCRRPSSFPPPPLFLGEARTPLPDPQLGAAPTKEF